MINDVITSFPEVQRFPFLGNVAFAASVYFHPEYNNLNDVNYNNYIALIKLQNPIMLNSSVMPIC